MHLSGYFVFDEYTLALRLTSELVDLRAGTETAVAMSKLIAHIE